MRGKDVGEVKGVDELGLRVACRGARSRGNRRSKVEVAPKRCSLRHDMLTLLLRPYMLFLRERNVYYEVGRRPEKIVGIGVKLRESEGDDREESAIVFLSDIFCLVEFIFCLI